MSPEDSIVMPQGWENSVTCSALRRDLPRKASLSGYSDKDIDSIVWNLNATPRKCLGFRTPIEAFASQLGVALEN
jgi:IS30 family transposase